MKWTPSQFKEYYGMTRQELATIISNELYLGKEKERIRSLIEDVSDGQTIIHKCVHTNKYKQKMAKNKVKNCPQLNDKNALQRYIDNIY
jgi:hypothetical protein